MRRFGLALVLTVVAMAGAGSAGAAAGPAVSASVAPPAIAVAFEYACGLSTSGTVKCWGETPGSAKPHLVPVAVNGIANATAIAAGEDACALLGTGAVECWGYNRTGIRGDGSTTTATAPTAVSGVSTAIAIAVSDHACVVLKDASVECWGDNTKGELGNGEFGTFSSTPVAVKGLSDATAVSTGSQFTCALRKDRTVWCWGRDSNGALGTGGPPLGKSLVPVQVKDLTGAIKIASNGLTTCVVVLNGNVKCWGSNISGQAGNGRRNYGRLPAPVKVDKVSHAISISMGSSVGCAVLAGGTTKCWGTNDFGVQGTGILPDGVRHAETVVGVAHGVSVSVSYVSACALISDGTARCWGMNDRGALGTGGTNKDPHTAVVVKGLNLGKSA